MNMVAFVSVALATGLLAHTLAAFATRQAARGTLFANASFVPDLTGAGLGAIGGTCVATLHATGADPLWAVAVFLLTAGAISDARWAWAPDMILVPLAIIAVVSLNLPLPLAILAAALIILLPLLVFALLNLVGRPLFTPPDMIAVMLPSLFLGISATASATYMVSAIALLAALKVRGLRGNAAALEDAKNHVRTVSSDDNHPRAALLGLFFPICAIALTLTHGAIL
jgi:hypothetical protein